MQEVAARAALVTAPDVQDGLTTSVSRAEIEKAIRAEEPPELIIDVTRFAEGAPAETRSVAVAWERGDLEQLLSSTAGEQVTLTFDREALQNAVESDVEAHGLREKALILAVAATAAAGAAGSAAAMPQLGEGTGGQVVMVGEGASGQAVEEGSGAGGQAVDAGSGAGGSSVTPDDRDVSRANPVAGTTGFSADDRAVSRATPTPEPSLGPDDRAVSRATPTAEPSLGPDDRALPRATPTSGPSLSPDDRAVPRSAPGTVPATPSTGDDSTWFSAPSPETTAAIGGAVALAITGAAFGIAARRRVRPA
jgi:hypothetical protein